MEPAFIPPPKLPPLPAVPQVNPAGQGQTVLAGANQLLNNDPGVNGITSLDGSADDPSTALLNETAKKAGCTVAELQARGFKFEKGFRPEKDNKDTPIPIHAYSNPPGPDCYYFVRHWRVTVNDANGNPMEMHFTKKIYTNVEVPRNMDPVAHKQQQYIAALAARTYANVEEARMLKTGAGVENALYGSIKDHMSKIAHDRFVTLEMFHNAKSVAINPSKIGDIKDITVDSVRLKFRAAKGAVEGEHKHEGFHAVVLTPIAIKLKNKPYRFTAGDSPSAHVRKVTAALNTDDAFEMIKNDVDPKKAFAEVGLNLSEVAFVKDQETKAAAKNFYNQTALFGDRESIRGLMANHGGGYEISQGMLSKIAAEKSLMDKLRSRKPEDLAVLKKLDTLMGNNPTDADKAEARKILDATKKVHENMKKDHEALSKLEQELRLMGEDIPPAPATERDNLLKEIQLLMTHIERALPAANNNPPIHNVNFAVDDEI